MKRFSLRWRITLWITIAFAAVLTGFSWLVYEALWNTHLRQVDAGLYARLGDLSSFQSKDHATDPFDAWIHELGRHAGVSGAIANSNGEITARSSDFSMDVAPTLRSSGWTSRHCQTFRTSSGDYRGVFESFEHGSIPYIAVVLAELEHVQEEMALVVGSLVWVAPLTLVAAAVLAYTLAWRALAPMERLRRAAAEITADRLDRRLPIENPRDELGMLTDTMNSMLGRIERSVDRIRHFTADASHELRTPLTIIRSEAELGLESSASGDETQSRFTSIIEECDVLGQLTEHLLSLARLDASADAEAPREISFSQLVHSTCDVMRPVATAHGLNLDVSISAEPVVQGIPAKLRQVVLNLLDNAIKYTPRGGTISLSLDRVEDRVILQVTDTGPGIRADQLPRIFDRFFRGDAPTDSAERGAGLGLSIVQSVVDQHGGQIEVQSGTETGSTFTVILPAESSDQRR